MATGLPLKRRGGKGLSVRTIPIPELSLRGAASVLELADRRHRLLSGSIAYSAYALDVERQQPAQELPSTAAHLAPDLADIRGLRRTSQQITIA